MKGISYRPLADMHSDGVYFDMEEQRLIVEETICAYSGLPSVSSYEEQIEQEPVIGHS